MEKTVENLVTPSSSTPERQIPNTIDTTENVEPITPSTPVPKSTPDYNIDLPQPLEIPSPLEDEDDDEDNPLIISFEKFLRRLRNLFKTKRP